MTRIIGPTVPQFVNVYGEPVDVTPPKKGKNTTTPKTRSVTDPAAATHSFGFLVTGFSPAALQAAEQQHQFDGKHWDAAVWMARAKPQRIRPTPYELFEAAQQCAELARKAGWKGVCVTELLGGAV